MKDALVVIGGVLLPDAASARKNAGKLHGGSVVCFGGDCVAFPVHFCGVCLPFPMHLSGVCLPFPVHFSGVCLPFPVHFSGVLAAAIVLLLINLGAAALEPTHHRPNALRQRLQHLDDQMHMVGHHHLCQHFQGIALPLIELRKPAKHLTHAPPEGVEPDKSRFGTLALEDSKQRVTPLHRKREMIDGTATVIPSRFTMMPHGVNRPPMLLTFIDFLCQLFINVDTTRA
ncbi:MAG: hypothetical protein IJS63_11710 [Bacteroidaceae bacterium]|nr:hypothetical protein [Bacteroidaceae bacterium]